MKHDDNAGLSYFEARISRELAEIEAEIRKLEAEAVMLRRQLGKAKAERLGLQHATRKNSVNRVLAENSVLEQLREVSPLSTKFLYRRAKLNHSDLKETTFRTYLHRMKQKGLIKTAKSVGQWELVSAPPQEKPDTPWGRLIVAVTKQQERP